MSQSYQPNWTFVRSSQPLPPAAPNATHYRWLALGVLLLTSYGCLIPLRYQSISFGEAVARFRHMSYYDPSLLGARGDWVISMVQFAVLSYLSMAVLSIDRRWVFGLTSAAIVVPACIAVSVVLEFLQIYFPPRTISLNDLVVESLGSVAGVLLWLVAGQSLSDWIRRSWNVRGLPRLAAQCLPAYLVLLLIVQLMPFDFTIGREELAQKYREGRISLLSLQVNLSWLKLSIILLIHIFCFAPVGIMMALAPRCIGLNQASVLRLGLVVTAIVELLQLFVFSRDCRVIDVITGAAAILLSWRLTRNLAKSGVGGTFPAVRPVIAFFRSRSRLGWTLLFGIWLGTVILVNWQPFGFTTDPAQFATADGLLTDEDTAVFGLRRMTWAPLVDYYWASKYNALDQFVQKSLSFVPLGILIGFTIREPERPGTGLIVVVLALMVALGIEIGQYFIPARHPSTSDLLIESFGAWIGFAMTRHVFMALSTRAIRSKGPIFRG